MIQKSTLAACALALLVAGPATAQEIVHDPMNYASLIQQAQTGISQLQQLQQQVSQAQRLYDGFNSPSHVGALASLLDNPALRAALPDVAAFTAAAKGDFSSLQQIGQQALAIRQANRLYTPPTGDASGQDLEAAGDRAARDLALGQQTATAGAQRLAGLQTLTAAIDAAPDARAVMDLQARLTAEHAMIANDQMRLQGLAMAQAAEERLQSQRDRERAAAASDARLQLFRSGFQ
ncbi:type IV secretion system protein [Phenylobacterium sp.]|uniref:type IV secretion system protein n=1 Tax=Phenylobacterium sp. TaxID=1871053 RepID=UPI00356A5A71